MSDWIKLDGKGGSGIPGKITVEIAVDGDGITPENGEMVPVSTDAVRIICGIMTLEIQSRINALIAKVPA